MIWQDAVVQHVRVGQQDPGRSPNLASLLGGSIAIEDGHPYPFQPGIGVDDVTEGTPLVLGQGLGGEEVEGGGPLFPQEPVQHRGVVDQALSTGRGRGYHYMGPGPEGFQGLGLMPEQGKQTKPFQGLLQGGVELCVGLGKTGLPGGYLLKVDHLAVVLGELAQASKDG